MQIEYINPKNLVPYENNTRKHPKSQIEHLMKLIQEYGFNRPVLIEEDNTIIAGHGRIEAALQLDMKEVPCIRLTGYSKDQLKVLRIADNKVALTSEWDDSLLREELNSMSIDADTTGLLGFSAQELEYLTKEINIDDFFIEVENISNKKEPKMIKCPHCNQEFQHK